MRSAWVIAAKDLRVFLVTPQAYVAAAAFLFIYGVLYAGAVMTPRSVPVVDIGSLIMTMPVALALLVPLLTMRAFAEERRTGSEILYRALPLSGMALAAGKFLAVAGLFLAMLALSLVFPLFTRLIGGTVDAKAFFSYLAFFFLGLAYIAVGIAFSARTDSQMTCAVATFIILFFLQGLGRSFALVAGNATAKLLWAASSGHVAEETLAGVRSAISGFLLWINPASKLALFNKGFFRLCPILYFASFVLLFLCLAAYFYRRLYRRSGVETLRLCAVGLVLLGLNAAVDRWWDESLQWDVTPGRVYSIGDGTRGILAGLEAPILVWGLFDEDPENRENDTVLFLDQYVRNGGGKVSLRFRNPEANLGMLAAEGLPADLDLTGAVFIVLNRQNGRFKIVSNSDILVQRKDLGGESVQMLSIEQAFTGAIRYVSVGDTAKAYVTRGHGEERRAPLYGRLLAMLKAGGFGVETLDLALGRRIPEDASLVCMLGPETDVDAKEAEELRSYLRRGGALVVLAGFTRDPLTNLASVVGKYGIDITGNRLRETHPELRFGDDPYSFVAVSPDSEVLPGVKALIAIMAREIRSDGPPPPGLARSNLLQTSKGGLAEPGGVPADGGAGIRTIGVAVEKPGAKPAKLAVIGTAESFQDSVMDGAGTYSETHRSFLARLFAWVSGREDAGLGIYAKGIPNYAVAVTSDRLPILYFSVYCGLFILPLALLAAGIIVQRMRKGRCPRQE